MSKKKLLLIIFMVAAMLPLLSACHGSQERTGFTVPASFDDQTPIELVFWAKNDTNKTQTAVYQQAIDDFHALYPNVTVTMRLYTDYSRIYNDVITNISTDTTPNICITYPDHIATYITGSNVVTPLDELMADARFGLGGSEVRFDAPTAAEIIPEFLEEGKINGVTYAMPYMRSTEAVYINKTYVEKLGYEVPDELTWDFLWEVSEAALAKNADGTFAVNGQNVLIPFIYKSTDNMMIQMLKQLDAPYSTPEGDILIFNDTVKDLLFTISPHAASQAFSTFKISSYPANFLNAGQCIFAIDSTAGSTWMGTDAPLCDISPDKIVRFETVVRAIPQFDPQHPKMISQGPSVCIFNKRDPQEVLASWLFAQFLLTNDVQIAYSETEGYVPVTMKAQNDPAYQDYLSRGGEDNKEHYFAKIEAVQLLLDHTGDTFVTPVFNGSASLRDAAGQLIEEVCKSRRRGQTVDEAYMEGLFDKINSLYRLDQTAASVGGTGAAEDLGPLPAMSKGLLIVLALTWCGIAVWWLRSKKKE